MNPELRRNLQIEFTAQRAVAMPVVLGLIFAASGTVGDIESVGWASSAAFWVLTLLWGTRRAAALFDNELANNTWDGQRMSALSAMELFVGKIAGGLSYVFYGLAICISVGFFARVAFAVGLTNGVTTGIGAAYVIVNLVADVVTALLAIAVSMFVATVLMRRPRATKGISVTLCQAMGIAAAAAAYWSRGAFSDYEFLLNENVAFAGWYGIQVEGQVFAVASVLAFLAWAVLGTVRVLREILQFHDRRWAWAAFVLFTGLYFAGFDGLYAQLPKGGSAATIFLMILWIVAISSTYQAVLFEPKRIRDLRAFVAAVNRRNLRAIHEHVPFWLISFAIAFVLMLVSIVFVTAVPIMPDAITDWFGDFGTGATLRALLILTTLFVLRDALLVVGLNLKGQPGRADMAAMIYLVVLYLILPLFLMPFFGGVSIAMSFFRPQPTFSLFVTIWPILAEIAIIGLWTLRRWQRVRDPILAAPMPA